MNINLLTMIRTLFPTRVFDLYSDLENVLDSFVPVENGTLTLDVPGFSKKDITLEIDQSEGLISIEGEKEINGKKRTLKKTIKDYRLRNVDLDAVEAKIEDGVLSIYLKELDPKTKEKKRQISLN
jgi:HSP20 family molecular chaperone IbpA